MKFDRYLVKISALYVRYLKGATGYITPPSLEDSCERFFKVKKEQVLKLIFTLFSMQHNSS